MTTTTETSQARQMADRLANIDWRAAFIGAPPAQSTVSHTDYTVSYYADKSILLWSILSGYLVLDESRTYYRDTVDHLARCLGLFSRERRAAMVGGEDKWIDGIHWSATGEFLGM